MYFNKFEKVDAKVKHRTNLNANEQTALLVAYWTLLIIFYAVHAGPISKQIHKVSSTCVDAVVYSYLRCEFYMRLNNMIRREYKTCP